MEQEEQRPVSAPAADGESPAASAAAVGTDAATDGDASAPVLGEAAHEPVVLDPVPSRRWYVGVGASAGGLEALSAFVAHLPQGVDMTYIVAQHMSPSHRSMMVELLSRETSLRIEMVQHDTEPMPDTLYVVPPNTDVIIHQGRMLLSEPSNTIGPKPSVNRLLMSMADDRGERCVGIVLSGTGSDGAHGIKAIRAVGGLTVAQSPESAKYDSMPQAALRIGGADFTLAPEAIGQWLADLARGVRTPLLSDQPISDEINLATVLRLVATHTGLDFRTYKEATLSRQVARRAMARQCASVGDYMRLLSDPNEVRELAATFLICVTSFFRDASAFAVLNQQLRQLLDAKQPGDAVRVWVPGCATGEEAYSIAILLTEYFGERIDQFKVQIFATDINADALATARQGVYPRVALADMPPPLAQKYFTVRDDFVHVDPGLKKLILFSRQDVTQDPPFVRLDLVSCRNLLIYFKSELQERMVTLFHYALVSTGLLFLGSSESLGKLDHLFSEVDRRQKVYSRLPSQGGLGSTLRAAAPRLGKTPGRLVDPPARGQQRPWLLSGLERLSRLYAPPSVLVGREGEILEVFGECSPYLGLRPGRADFNLFSLVDPMVRAEARALLHSAQKTRERTVGGVVAAAGGTPAYRVVVHPASDDRGVRDDALMVSFEPVVAAGGGGEATPTLLDAAVVDRVRELEQDLMQSRENLQTVIEELETANEELQSLNEEAQAANEELQASNEELETANEELQASNEELMTVNEELNVRTVEAARTGSDLTNVVESLDQALVVVDRGLQVTRYNQLALRFFKISPVLAANLATLEQNVDMPHLLSHVQTVLREGLAAEYTFADRNTQRQYTMQLSPYVVDRLLSREVSGVVLAILDSTDDWKAAPALELAKREVDTHNQQLQEQTERLVSLTRRLRLATDAAELGVWSWDFRSGLVDWDDRMHDLYEVRPADRVTAMRMPDWVERVHPDDRVAFQQQMQRTQYERTAFRHRFRLLKSDGSLRRLTLEATPELDLLGEVRGMVGVQTDVTETERLESQLRSSDALFRAFMEHSGFSAWVKDEQLRYLYVSPALSQQAGQSQADWLGRTDHELFKATAAAECRAYDLQALSGNAPLVSEETRGSHIWLYTRFSFADAYGQRYLGGVGVDITERKSVEQALLTARDEARSAEQAKASFLANMSRQVRQPLHLIVATAEALAAALSGEAERADLARIGSSARQLISAVDDVLNFAQASSGRVVQQPQVSGLRPIEIAQGVADAYAPTAAEHGVTLEVEGDDAAGLLYVGDAQRLSQILSQFVSNAVRVSQGRPVQLTVRRTDSDGHLAWLRYEVIDHGPGLSAERVQALRSGDAAAQGVIGVGLAMAHRLCELLGGRHGIESQPGEGATFWVEVPLVHQGAGGGPTNLAQSGAALRGKHLLVVDSTPIGLSVMTSLLQSQGARCIAASSERRALAQLIDRTETVDALVIDTAAGDAGYLETVRRLRSVPTLSELPVVLVLPQLDDEVVAAAAAAGASAVLGKGADLAQRLVEQLLTLTAGQTERSGLRPWPVVDGVDTARARQVAGGDRAFHLRLLNLLVDLHAGTATQVLADVQADRLAAAHAGLHNLGSALLSVGAVRADTLCCDLTDAIDRQQDLRANATSDGRELAASRERCVTLAQALHTEMSRLLAALRGFLHDEAASAQAPAAASAVKGERVDAAGRDGSRAPGAPASAGAVDPATGQTPGRSAGQTADPSSGQGVSQVPEQALRLVADALSSYSIRQANHAFRVALPVLRELLGAEALARAEADLSALRFDDLRVQIQQLLPPGVTIRTDAADPADPAA
ncbi:MAG: hypothetical protein RIQ60_3170 [Pseudomonadota bacterium]